MSLLFSFCITSFNSFLFFFLRLRPPLRSTLFPYTTLFRSKSGVRFTSGYVSGPYCSPTRAGLLTGRYQTRFGHEFNPGSKGPDVGLPLTETTIADRLKKAGYATGLVGKWHLGDGAKFHPQKR